MIGSYVIRATGQFLLSRALLNVSGFDMQTSTSSFFMVMGGVPAEKERQVNRLRMLAYALAMS